MRSIFQTRSICTFRKGNGSHMPACGGATVTNWGSRFPMSSATRRAVRRAARHINDPEAGRRLTARRAWQRYCDPLHPLPSHCETAEVRRPHARERALIFKKGAVSAGARGTGWAKGPGGRRSGRDTDLRATPPSNVSPAMFAGNRRRNRLGRSAASLFRCLIAVPRVPADALRPAGIMPSRPLLFDQPAVWFSLPGLRMPLEFPRFRPG
jgi:hypothetical protein